MKEKKAAFGKRQSKAVEVNQLENLRHIELTPTTLDNGFSQSPEEKKKILRERAKKLAQVPGKEESAGEYIEVVEFLLGYERYGIESSFVREVYKMNDLTPLPGLPPFVLGVINLRGQIISVIDLKKLFELPEKGLTDLDKVLVLQNQEMEFGILADTVLDVRHVSLSGLQPSLPTLTGIRQEYLKGITGDRVVILDAEKLLTDKKLIIHEEV